MKTYFVSSDIHSFYDEWMDALKVAGFDMNNPEHIIVVCGDLFDRGPDAMGVWKFAELMKSIGRGIFIRGNHENLLMDIFKRNGVYYNDFSNKTVDTIVQLTGLNEYDVEYATREAYYKMRDLGIIDFIYDMPYYFRLGDTIFTHGYLPTDCAMDGDWEEATWSNGMEAIHRYRLPDSMVVVGHWHCNWERDKRLPKEEQWKDFSIYMRHYADTNSIIVAIDGCTAYSGRVNVAVFNEEGALIRGYSNIEN